LIKPGPGGSSWFKLLLVQTVTELN